MKDNIVKKRAVQAPVTPPWSFYAIRKNNEGQNSATIEIAKAMTSPGTVALPSSSIKQAAQILRKMAATGLAYGDGYTRLLKLALACEPAHADLFRSLRGLMKHYLASERADRAMAFYEVLPAETQERIAPEIAAPIISLAAMHFSPDEPAAPLAVAEPYFQLPQIRAFKRLPAICDKFPETLPIENDAPMLRALLRQPEISDAVKSEVVDRLFERALKGLPQDLEIARLCLKRFRFANQLKQARQLSRQITRSADSRISDLANRIDVLARLGRLDVINRYVRGLERIHAANGCNDLELASRLWAAGFPTKSLEKLGPTDQFLDKPEHIHTALRALVRLRRFKEAQALVEQARGIGTLVQRGVAKQIERACTYISERRLHPEDGKDNALAVVQDIISTVQDAPKLAYIPVSKRVLITTQSIAIGGAERQVTGQALGLAREADVESVKILANRDSEVTYDVHDQTGKLIVSCARSAPPNTTTLNLHGIDLGEVSASFGITTLRRFYDEIIEFRPEVVHVRSGQHIEVALAALLAGTPRIVVHFGSMTRGQQSLGNDISKLREDLLEQGLAMAASVPNLKLVANSRSAADDWADAMKLDRSQVGIITNSIDIDAFSRTRSAGGSKHNELVIGGVFRFAPVKDPLMWIEIAAMVAKERPETRFIMVGDGPMRASVELLIDKLGLRERFVLPGLITSGVASWLEQMDVFLMTSRTESLPNSVIEAQLMGLPVVAPDVGGIAEVFATPTSGKVCERNAETLANAAIEYLDDTTLRAKIRTEAPAGIKRKFSSARQITDVRAVYGWSLNS